MSYFYLLVSEKYGYWKYLEKINISFLGRRQHVSSSGIIILTGFPHFQLNFGLLMFQIIQLLN